MPLAHWRGKGRYKGLEKEFMRKKSEGKLSMMCWNVCGWCKGGWQIDQMREDLKIRAEVIDFYKPDIVTLVETWLKGDEEVVVEGYEWFGNNRKHLHRKARFWWSWNVDKRGSTKTLPSRDLGSRDRGHVVREAEPGRKGRGTSLGSVLCFTGVIEPWKELRRVLSDISRAGGKVWSVWIIGPTHNLWRL